MTRLTIRHETTYTYDRPVRFGPHRLMLRPRDSHAVRLIDAHLTLSPPGATRWTYDALGNCVCWYEPQGEATTLRIVSDLVIEAYPAPLAPLKVNDPKSTMPVDYDLADRAALLPFLEPADDDVAGLMPWLREQMGQAGEPAIDVLLRLAWVIHAGFSYRSREKQGVQSPARTLELRSGACRDFAWLMVEGLRRLGFAARFVSGYLHSAGGAVGGGATHAWCEVFLPDIGWMGFDPTNGLAESPDLIPVAISRTPAEAAPVSGTLIGDPGGANLSVFVDVQVADAIAAAA